MVSTPRRVSHAAQVEAPLQEAQHALIVRMGEQRAATRRISFVSDVKLDFGLPLVITSARNAKQVVIKTRNWSQNVKLARKELTTKSEVPPVLRFVKTALVERTPRPRELIDVMVATTAVQEKSAAKMVRPT